MTAGYSGKSLVDKLGFKPGDSIFVEDTPDWYSEFADDNKLELEPGLPATHAHIFCAKKSELLAFLKDYSLDDIEKSLWLSWPKQSSGVKTDLHEQDLRDSVLPPCTVWHTAPS
jgi:hypothetical protein